MQSQIKKWGNSQGLRLSKELLKEANISEKDNLIVEALDGKIVIYKKNKRLTLEERAAMYSGKLNLSEEIDWGTSVGREMW